MPQSGTSTGASAIIATVALGLEYDGTLFHGFQTQPGRRTVQEVLERALTKVADEPIRVTVAGRTDAGVHATQQVASFATHKSRPLEAWTRGSNSLLPADVAVVWAKTAPPDFHARYSARSRRYLYLFGQADVIPAIGRTQATWLSETLDTGKMAEAAAVLEGEQDFSSFRAAGCQSKTPCRHVHFARVCSHGNHVVFDIQANAFLLRMVRNLAGALLGVSRGSLTTDGLRSLLAARDRCLAPPTAPAQGLYLVHVGYPEFGQEATPRLPPMLSSCFPGHMEGICS